MITYTRDETKLAASATSDVAVVTISKGGQTAPAENEGYAISCADETITVTESYEVYTCLLYTSCSMWCCSPAATGCPSIP